VNTSEAHGRDRQHHQVVRQHELSFWLGGAAVGGALVIDVYTGVFTYFGDNKRSGFALHDTPRRGEITAVVFCNLHTTPTSDQVSRRFLYSREETRAVIGSPIQSRGTPNPLFRINGCYPVKQLQRSQRALEIKLHCRGV
jgi:hypothetical protein